VDGEGWLAIDKTMRSRLEVTNRNADLMFWLTQKFGGSFRIIYRQRDKGHPAFRWELTGKRLVELLDKILGFLIVKKDKAAEILERGEGYGTE